MKNGLCIAICTVLMGFPEVALSGLSAAVIESGHAENGAFVIPLAIAAECKVKLDDKKASSKVTKCLKKLIKRKAKDAEEAKTVGDIFKEAIKQSEIESLKTYIAEKIYASYYEEEVVKPLQEEMKGSAGGGSSSSMSSAVAPKVANAGGGKGDTAAANIKEDWSSIAKSDTMISAILAEHLNNVLATEILHTALLYLSNYGETYLEEE